MEIEQFKNLVLQTVDQDLVEIIKKYELVEWFYSKGAKLQSACMIEAVAMFAKEVNEEGVVEEGLWPFPLILGIYRNIGNDYETIVEKPLEQVITDYIEFIDDDNNALEELKGALVRLANYANKKIINN